MVTLRLFVDVDGKSLVSGVNDPAEFRPPTFYQGDTVSVEVTLLRRTAYYNSTVAGAPFERISIAPLSLRIGIGTPDAAVGSGAPVIYQNEFTKDTTANKFGGEMFFSPSAVATLLGSATTATSTIEIEVGEDGKYTTVYQGPITIAAELIEEPTTASPPPPGDSYYTRAETNALFVKRDGGAGDVIILRSPDGSKICTLWLDNDGVLHQDITED